MRRLAAAVTALAAVALWSWPTPSEACGGFFCSTVPIDQSGEDIIFNIGDGKVEAHVSIQYVGDAKDFAWVVPVHGVPDLKVGSPQFFQYVQMMTRPQFNLNWTENSCWSNQRWFGAAEDATSAPNASAGGTGVTVLAQGNVGPYDSAILGATDVNALSKWLNDNGYVLPDSKALEPYVGRDYNFLALKLQQDRTVGELRPIVIDFGGARPCIPIQLTAVAARPDMPIRAYVFADKRAVPINYRHVLINETRVDWLNFGQNYSEIASRAVDEAGGRAFLTEFAGGTAFMKNPGEWILPGPSLNTAALAQKTHPVDFTEELFMQGFPRGDGALFAMFQKYIPLPKSLEGTVTPQQFYNSIGSYRTEIDNDPNRMMFDAAGFAAELEESIVKPLLRAREIINLRPYMTRLYTTMSAEEMTVDPEFEFNGDAEDVSNMHEAEATAICGIDGQLDKVEITLKDGTKFTVSDTTGPVSDGPFAARIEQYTEAGAPGLIKDNTQEIAAVVSTWGNGCGCGAAGMGPMGILFIAGAALLRRRRA